MSNTDLINAEPREDAGKGASRRLRRRGLVPAVVYGGDKSPESVALDQDFLIKATAGEAFFTHILKLKVNGTTDQVVVRDVQRHPAKPDVLHVDFLRISEKEELRMSIPLHFTGEKTSPAGKKSGVVISHYLTDVEILCLPKDLPEYIEVDLSALDAGDSSRLSELKLPSGVKLYDLEHGGEEYDAIVVAAQYVREDQGERQLEDTEAPEAAEVPTVAEAEAEGEEADGEGDEGKAEDAKSAKKED